MTTLYSYCLRTDDGAAPNPYGGLCTLAICKPPIRRSARKGDWIVGHGSVHSQIGDIASSVIYAMRVTDVMSMEEYDVYCKASLEEKLPIPGHRELWRRAGDSIYDFSTGASPVQRIGVHDPSHMAHDLGGRNVLLSNDFYYFGDRPVAMPEHLLPIIRRGQGYRSRLNAALVQPFEQWIRGLGYERNRLYGDPIDIRLLNSVQRTVDCSSPLRGKRAGRKRSAAPGPSRVRTC